MPRAVKVTQKSDMRIASGGAHDANTRRLLGALKKRDKDSYRFLTASNQELDTLQREYRKRLSTLLSPSCLRELDDIRDRGAKLSRAQKERRALSALKACGVHRAQLLELRRPYLRKARDIMAQDELPSVRRPHEDPCDAQVTTFLPPFGGWYWSYYWERTSNPGDPVISDYLDNTTGRVGSRIRTSVSGADDDDRVYVEYQTGFNIWYVAQRTGPIEVQLTFEFPRALLAGKVRDEWFWSDCAYYQFVQARVRATNSQAPNQFEDSLSLIDNVTGYSDGHDATWSKPIASPFETRTYRVKTIGIFDLGTPVLLETGVRHVTRFETNDMSVSTNADIDLRLKRIDVRSCYPVIL
jgi:hypothetical protein